MKKFITFFYCLVLLVSYAYGNVGGTTSDGLTWSYNTQTKELTISGSGDMHDYLQSSDTHQWEKYKKEIKKITIKHGVTSIGSRAFDGCTAFKMYIYQTALRQLINWHFIDVLT